ncbi:hypothetical protein HPP92_004266 [Vanilla planifolia]|uniref:Uncharacterized protein n=1 Tax=Vanilla planifolia TaxID=51239 RepID=A0A835RWE2_VANPL|nr:hypothetical protein HPP92_004266 [Vanilla planifolia]
MAYSFFCETKVLEKERELNIKDETIAQFERELNIKDETIAQFEREVQKKASSIALLENEIQGKDATVVSLETEIHEKAAQVLSLERDIQEKAASIVLLQSEIGLLHQKGAVDAEELVGKAHARSNALEEELEKLKDEVDVQTRKRDTLEARAIEAEKKVQEINLKLQSLEKLTGEQKHKIQKTERALQVAEEELIRMRLEAASKLKELKEVHGAWLPPWFVSHLVRCQEITAAEWKEHGKPALDVLVQTASEKSQHVQKWMEPYLQTAKNVWIPTVKAKWATTSGNIRPHVERMSTKTVEIFEVCRNTMTPHIVKLQESAKPYVQEARKITKPYIEHVATAAKPHGVKLRAILKPYTRRLIYGYGKFLEAAKTYHHQVQEAVQEYLKKHELTKPLATKELVWFTASASLALPIFVAYRMLSLVFGKKAAKPVRSARSNNNHRRHKRRHADQ